MARLWSTGFELQSVGSAGVGVEWDITSTTAPSINTSTKRSGAAALRCNPTTAACFIGHQILASSTVTHVYLRTYLWIATLPSADTPILSWNNGVTSSAVSGPYWSICLKTDGTLIFKNSASVTLGSASSALSTGRWYRLEADITDSATTTGSAVFYIDGTSFNNVTGIGMNGANWIAVGPHVATTCDLYFDDVAINDTSGTAQTGRPGAGSIVHLRPDSAGDNAGWAAGAGGTNNWDRVSEVTPDDATTYNAKTTTGAATDDHNCGTSAGAGIGASDTVTLVAVGGRIGSTATSTADLIYRVKSQAAGTVLSSAAASVAVNGWRPHGATAPRLYKLTSYTDPQAGGAWTPALLDTMQIGYTTSTSNTNARRVSTLWALVEYVPATSFSEPTSDSAPATNAATRALAQARAAADTASGTDSTARAAVLPRATVDTAAATDATTRSVAEARPASDTAGGTDAATATVRLARPAADTTSLSDAVARTLVTPRSPTDSAPATDAATRATTTSRAAADTASATDATAVRTTVSRAASDTTTLADAATRGTTLARTAADTTTTSDAAGRILVAARATPDTAAATDAIARSVALARAAGDATTLSDSPSTGGSTAVSTADSAPAIDAITFGITLARPASDTATVADSPSRRVVLGRPTADTTSVADAASVATSLPRALSDAGPATDAAAAVLAQARAVVDNAAALDAAAWVVLWFRAVADSAPATDSATADSSVQRDLIVVVGEPVDRWHVGSPVDDRWLLAGPVDRWYVGEPVDGRWHVLEPVDRWLIGGGLTVLVRSALTKEYVPVPVEAKASGAVVDPSGDVVKMAFTTPGAAPTDDDWQTSDWDPVPEGDAYFARCLVGPGGTIALAIGTYDIWVKIIDSPETVVRQPGELRITA